MTAPKLARLPQRGESDEADESDGGDGEDKVLLVEPGITVHELTDLQTPVAQELLPGYSLDEWYWWW